MSKYKNVTIEDINEILGFDITEDTRETKVVRARQGAWLCFCINDHSYKDIAKMFGFARSTVAAGVDMLKPFERGRQADGGAVAKTKSV